jgi:hypothetical protein
MYGEGERASKLLPESNTNLENRIGNKQCHVLLDIGGVDSGNYNPLGL